MVVARKATRLPVTVSPPSRGAEVAKGLTAVVGTALIVVGIPLALVSAVGAPWPTSAPDRSWLSAELTADGLLKVLAVIVWLAWAHFVVCLIVEAVAERLARGLAPRVPGGGIGTQTLARRLIGAMLLLVASASMSISSASAAVGAGSQHHDPVQVRAERAVPTSAVAAPDEAPDESAGMPAAGDLEHATKADVREQKHGLVTYYDVKPPAGRNYDTLWDMAERYLGDGFRYKEIYDLNKGVTQPDGRVLKNADLIYPGWVMRLPADAKGPGLKVVDHAEQTPAQTPGGQGDASAGTPTDAPQPVEAASGMASVEQDAEAGADRADAGGSDWSPVYGIAGGLVAAGIALGLRRRRAGLRPAALWAARTDPDPDGPGSGPPSPGAALRDESDLSTARWLDRALRSWNSGAAAAPVPAPARCTVAASGLAVAFGSVPDRPAPDGWEASHDGRVWRLPHEASLPDVASGPSPAPGLVSVGRRDDGSILMLDLESVPGLVSIGGDPAVARAVAMSLAVDTATHAWADERRVTMVGFADDLTPVGQGNISAVDDLERVLESLDNLASYQRSACRRADTVSARTARSRPDSAAGWRYELVVCSGPPAASAVQRLADLAADQQVSLAVVVVGDCPQAAARFAVDPGGRLSATMLGVDVAAQQLDVASSRAVIEMFELPPSGGALRLDEVADVLAAESDVADVAGDEAAVRVELMGPVTVTAPNEVLPQRHDLLTEIVSYVALHRQGVHVNLIGAAIWPRGVSAETRDAALAQAQEWLGDRDGSPRLAAEAGVWRLDRTDAVVDWDAFRQALNLASDNPRGREGILRHALELVRGQAWDEIPEGRYSWLANDTVEDDMRIAVGLTARVVAESAAQRDDADAARDALMRGLAMVPASEELWCAVLRLADRFEDTADTRQVADEMYAAIAAHGSPLGASAQTDALVEELLPGYRAHAA